MSESSHVLTIVIPALDEEEAIGGTIERCLAARETIIANSGVEEVEIIVVSDGSSDRTEEIAKSFDDVTVLVFEVNRGYGAAIKCGFAYGRGDLVSFLDGDGTCDPRLFADFCRAIDDQKADLVLGSRMGPDSQMPLIRTIGNTIFAHLLGALSDRSIKDTASGMRVIRRACLADLYPLPDGLHFTPAMSARVLLEDKLKIVERPMPYAERVGDSKLSVVNDGLRFFLSIIQAAATFQPARPVLMVAGLLLGASLVVGLPPVLFYLRQARLEEWMIYRLLLASLLVTTSSIFVCAAVVADKIASTAHGRPPTSSGLTGMLVRLFTPRNRLVGCAGLVVIATLVVAPGIWEFVSSGTVEMHWSRAALSSLLLVLAAVAASATFLMNMLELISANRAELPRIEPPERIHRTSET
ncbi:MAG: glycosyltransferase family 2 protein [Myxococcota bacterium]